MAVQDTRLELRAEQATLDRIQRVANLVHEQMSEFVRKAAMRRAEDVLRQELIRAMEPEQFDKLMSPLVPLATRRGGHRARKPAVFTRR